jgi:putative sigma-54 modulation protein
MEINVYYNNLEPSDAIRKYVETKIGRIQKYFDTDISAQVTLSVEKLNHFVKVTLNAHGYIVHVEEKDANLYSAIDIVSDTLERKIKKYIEKLKSKKNKNNNKSKVVEERVIEAQSLDKEEKKVIKIKNYEIKPMDIDEAVMQMDLLGRDFLVFIDSATDLVDVIYKRHDGNFGLIEAKTK